MAEENGNSSAGIETPVGKISFSGKKTAEFITIILAIGIGVMSYVIWVHAKDQELRDAKIDKAINSQAGAMRFFGCVIAHDQKDRMQQIEQPNSLCNRMARE